MMMLLLSLINNDKAYDTDFSMKDDDDDRWKKTLEFFVVVVVVSSFHNMFLS